jgi:hypothetical protein
MGLEDIKTFTCIMYYWVIEKLVFNNFGKCCKKQSYFGCQTKTIYTKLYLKLCVRKFIGNFMFRKCYFVYMNSLF